MLGITIDNKLTFDSRTKNIVEKLAKSYVYYQSIYLSKN